MPSGRIGRVPTTFISAFATKFMMLSLPSHFRGGIENGADDFVVAGAAAQVAGQPVAYLALSWVLVVIQQGLRGDDQPRRAETALQRRVLEELLLHRVQHVAGGDALDRDDVTALGLGGEHQAGTDQAAVDDDAAGGAVAGAAA